MMNNTSYLKLRAFLATTFLLVGCSGSDNALTGNNNGSGSVNSGGTNTSPTVLHLGSGLGSSLSEGTLEIKTPDIQANGSTTVTAYIVDDNNLLSVASHDIVFQSSCSVQQLASFSTATVNTTTGIVSTTYIDNGCQDSDTIVAVADGDPSLTATGSITINSTTTTNARIGTVSASGFLEGAIAITSANIASDGNTPISVNLVDIDDALLTSLNTVTFTSVCQQQGNANFTISDVTSSAGTFNTTYNASGCVGADTITATATVGSAVKVATGIVTVAAANAGSIQFTKASHSLIALQGTGTTVGLPENALITFTVVDGNNTPIANKIVDFKLSTTNGGITLSQASDTSGNDGVVTTIIQSGAKSTSVLVTATVQENTNLTTNSQSIVIATGPPDEDSMTLGVTKLNPRACNLIGQTVTATARLGDRFNNNVQDGRTIFFNSDLGTIDETFSTVYGVCSIT